MAIPTLPDTIDPATYSEYLRHGTCIIFWQYANMPLSDFVEEGTWSEWVRGGLVGSAGCCQNTVWHEYYARMASSRAPINSGSNPSTDVIPVDRYFHIISGTRSWVGSSRKTS